MEDSDEIGPLPPPPAKEASAAREESIIQAEKKRFLEEYAKKELDSRVQRDRWMVELPELKRGPSPDPSKITRRTFLQREAKPAELDQSWVQRPGSL